MRNRATSVVLELARLDRRVLALTADNRNEILEQLMRERPEQYLDYGIAEANMVASAAGLASCGKIPFIYTIGNFLSMRAFEFIRNDVCAANLPVKFLGRSSGLVSSAMGLTHQGTEELALLRCLPNLLTITPATPREAEQATRAVYEYDGPAYLRLEGYNEPELFGPDYEFAPGRAQLLRAGSDLTVMAMGSIINEALAAAEILAAEGCEVRLLNLSTVKPIDRLAVRLAAEETRGIVTLEEHSIYGGLGSAVAETLAEAGQATPLVRMGLTGFAQGCGSRADIRAANGLSRDHIAARLREFNQEGRGR